MSRSDPQQNVGDQMPESDDSATNEGNEAVKSDPSHVASSTPQGTYFRLGSKGGRSRRGKPAQE